MIAPPNFDVVRGPVVRALGWLGLVGLALLVVPSAIAGDQVDLDTFILKGPPYFTSSTTADFTFRSTVIQGTPEFWCALDDEAYAPCHGGTWRRTNLALGAHLFWVYAYDPRTQRVDATPANWEWVVEEDPADGGEDPADGGEDPADGGEDAGSPDDDGGSSTSDAGTGDNDGGTVEADAGPGSYDGGTSGEDAGTRGDDGGTPPDEDAGTGAPGDAGQPGPVPPGDTTPPDALDFLGGGMGCTGAPAPGALAGLTLLVLALHRRRGRR